MANTKWIVAALNRSLIFDIHTSKGEKPNISGVEGRFFEIIMTKLEVDYEIVIPTDGEFGRELTFGNWTGVIGMLHRGEADVGVANLGIYEDRYKTVDFGYPYLIEGGTFGILKQSKQLKMFSSLRLFDVGIWMSILCSFFISSLMLYFILKYRKSYFNVIFSLFGNMLRQPLSFPERLNKWKLMIGSWLIFTVTISSIYSGTLLSFLALPSQPKTVETFEELAESVAKGTHRVYTMKGTNAIPFMVTSPDEHLRFIGKMMQQKNWFFGAEEMTQDPLKKENYAVIGAKYIFDLLYGSEMDSKVLISKDFAVTITTAFAFRKGFCCNSKLNEMVGRLMGSGIYDKILQEESFKRWLSKSKNELKEEETKSLSVKDLSDAFILLLIGLSISFLVFLGEIVHSHFRN
ncbi:lig_chan-Glu_bd domain-containing protein [Nephila pilipes]|uniref:Lig_chan-Glu_bd domain-containing protein n=1 Tax=Nephila pilipes TaxID=299642 RepID=A0A8X6TR78_NEPPI|nr:lig_chan-Glu_bd domain-containing protein [Nephila pilipes]